MELITNKVHHSKCGHLKETSCLRKETFSYTDETIQNYVNHTSLETSEKLIIVLETCPGRLHHTKSKLGRGFNIFMR